MMQDKDVDLKKVFEGARIVSDRRYLFNVKIIYPDIDYALGPQNTCDHPYYTSHKEWAPPVEVADKWELPALVRDRYADSGGEGMSLRGLFPEIRRAWASIDNSLFLWSFETRDGKCQEYSVGAEVICAVGLAESKPVFDQVVQHLLVLATPTELILVGVSCARTTNKRDPYAELSLLSLPDYTVPSDGVIMSCITCTGEGRIFLAGRDGHIYELQYSARSFWRKHCRKVCLTSGLYSVISRWVVPDIFTSEAAVDPAIEMVFDNERSILYVRTEDMKLELFELDENKGVLRKAAEETNFMKQKDPSSKPYIVAISPISTLESTRLNLVAVLSDGRRMYYGRRFNYEGHLCLDYDNDEISNCLNAVSIRPCPPMMDLSNDSVQASYYSAGSLILSASSSLTSSSLIIVSKEYSAHPSRVGNIGTLVHTERLLGESVTCLPVEGRLLSAADILPLPDTAAILKSLYSMGKRTDFRDTGESLEKAAARLWSRRDLDLQHMLPRRRVIVLSTMGMLELVFNRPIDILRRLLESDSSREALEHFFRRFGTAEAAGMCLMLAAKIADNEHVIHNSVVDKATEAFENPRFVGKPQLEGNYRLLNTRTGQDGENAEPVFSGAYEGLCFCAVRLLDPVWIRPIMSRKNCSNSPEMRGRITIECRLSVRAMEVLENKLRSLERFLRLRKAKRRGLYARLWDSSNPSLGVDDRSMPCDLFRGYSLLFQLSGVVGSNTRQRLPDCPDDLADMEVRASECLRHVLLRSSEALFLLQLLSKHNVSHLVKRFNGSLGLDLLNTSFEKLVCWEDGAILATRLISTLLEYYTDRDDKGTIDDIIGELRKGCPSYFKEKNYKYYLGLERLERAFVSSKLDERENLAKEAFNFLRQVPLGADLHIICKKFEHLRFYEAVVKLPLQKAQALDPARDACNEQIDQEIQERVLAQREQCYEVIFIALRNLNGEALLNPSSSKKYIHQVVQLALESPDRKFREYLYQTMMDMSLENDLLEYTGPDMDRFLKHAEPRNEMNATPSSTKVKYL